MQSLGVTKYTSRHRYSVPKPSVINQTLYADDMVPEWDGSQDRDEMTLVPEWDGSQDQNKMTLVPESEGSQDQNEMTLVLE